MVCMTDLVQPLQKQVKSMLSSPKSGPVHDIRPRVSERVAGVLRDRIQSGLYQAGDPLPPERTLAADLGVHRRSIRMAIDQLAQDGFVSRLPNCRPTVGPKEAEITAPDPAADDSLTLKSRKSSPRISASNLIALIMWHGGGPLEHAGSSQQRIFWGMNQALMRLGYHAVFLDIGGERIGEEEEIAAREARHLHYIQEKGFGGALFYPYAYRSNSELVRDVSRSIPLVLLDRKMTGVEVDFVGIQNRDAMYEATQHLIAQGHRRIAHLTHYEPILSVQERIQGYLDAMRNTDEAAMTEMVITLPPYRDHRCWTMVDAVFRLPQEQRPTAVVCVNDYTAVGLAEHLAQIGLSVPGDVAITGFDNIVPTLPNGIGLTTVAQPYEQIGTTAVELLLRRSQDQRAAIQSLELSVSLIVRSSSVS